MARDYVAAQEMIRRSGQQGVPVVTAGDDVVVGFDQAKLSKIAERFAGPKRPPLGLLGADAEQYLAKHPETAAAFPAGVKGVYVGEVRSKSVAEAAGLKIGDVVQTVAGKRVRNITTLNQLIDTLAAGEKVSVTYRRGSGEESTEFQF